MEDKKRVLTLAPERHKTHILFMWVKSNLVTFEEFEELLTLLEKN